MRGVERGLDVLGGAAGDLGERLARDRGRVLEVLPLLGCDVLAADEVVVTGLEGDDASVAPGCRVPGHRWSSRYLGYVTPNTRSAAVASTLHAPHRPPRSDRPRRSASAYPRGADHCRCSSTRPHAGTTTRCPTPGHSCSSADGNRSRNHSPWAGGT